MRTAVKTIPIKLPAVRPAQRPPWKNGDQKYWVSVNQIAKVYGRSYSAVLRWCNDGTLQQFGFETYQDFMGKWWIKEPSKPSVSL